MKKMIDIAPFSAFPTAEEREVIREQSKPKPPTVKDVLLERWEKDTEAMAEFLTTNVQIDCEGFCPAHEAGCDNDCKKHMIAYLNSAAEDGK